MPIKKKVVLFLALVYSLALLAPFVLWSHLTFPFALWQLFYFSLGILSFTIGWHRYFVHHSFETFTFIKKALFFFGAMTFIGSLLDWIDDHHQHHRFLNQDADPTNRHRGWFYSHLGWSCFKRVITNQELFKDKFLSHVHRHAEAYSLLSGFIVPSLVDIFIFNFSLPLSLLASCLRIFLQQNIIALLGSECHAPEEENHSLNKLWVSLLCFGEGYQKNHHEDPRDYRHGFKTLDFDPTKWAIYLLSKLGLVWNLKVRKANEK